MVQVKSMYFCIPLMPKHRSSNWRTVSHLLQQTLNALKRQINKNFTVLLAAHEMPENLDVSGLDIRILHANWSVGMSSEEGLKDKRWKRKLLFEAVKALGGGYVMAVDADDLISNRLVQYVLDEANPFGYLITKGYVYDWSNKIIAPIPGAWQKDFDEICGSCAVINLHPDDLPGGSEGNLFEVLKQHSDWKNVMHGRGRPLHRVPFEAAVYVLNHNNNLHFEISANRKATAADRISQHAVPITSQMETEFGLLKNDHST